MLFARPYRACDNGSLEQLNGLIRHPKGTDFRPVPQTALEALRYHLNVCTLKVTCGKAHIDFIDQLLP